MTPESARSVFPAEISPLFAILSGSQAHLWYLPFMFFVLVLVNDIKHRLTKDKMLFAVFLLSALMLGTVQFWRPWSLAIGPPISQYIHSLAPIAAGIVIGCGIGTFIGETLSIVLMAAMLALCFLPFSGVGLPYFIGTLLPFILLKWQGLVALNWEPISRCMLGVYLIHPLILSATKFLAVFSPSVWVLVTFGISLALIWIAYRVTPRAAALAF
jgi:surface polysaccharide O-acyltransferase-like enzyme